jgi:hypothetical protein
MASAVVVPLLQAAERFGGSRSLTGMSLGGSRSWLSSVKIPVGMSSPRRLTRPSVSQRRPWRTACWIAVQQGVNSPDAEGET